MDAYYSFIFIHFQILVKPYKSKNRPARECARAAEGLLVNQIEFRESDLKMVWEFFHMKMFEAALLFPADRRIRMAMARGILFTPRAYAFTSNLNYNILIRFGWND